MTATITEELEQTKAYHRKRLEGLSIKTVGEIPHLIEPTEEEKAWVEKRLFGPARSWKVWDEK